MVWIYVVCALTMSEAQFNTLKKQNGTNTFM